MVPHLILIAPCFGVVDQFTADPDSMSTIVTVCQLVFNRCPLR